MENNYYWKVEYTDKSELYQYNDDGSSNKYTDIDRSRLNKFIILKDHKPFFIVNLDSNKRLIYRKRIAQEMNTKKQEIVYLVGYQELVNGRNVQMIAFIFETSGIIEVLDGFREGHAWFDKVNFLPEERL